MKLMPHQEDAVNKLANGKILYGGVGTGKSLTALGYYMKAEAPKDIYVITTAKKRDTLDWEGEAAKFGIGTSRAATLAGCINVDSWNSISKYEDVEDAFFIFDEQRLVGSGSWTKSFQRIAKKNRWIMLTATPGDTWLDYIQVFVANGFYKNQTEFKREHVVYAPFTRYPKVVRYNGVSTLEKWRNLLLVEMPYIKHTTRHIELVDVTFDKDLFWEAWVKRWHPYKERPIRDISELFFVMRKIVNSDPSRLETIKGIIQQRKKVIIFYSFDYELEILRTLEEDVTVAEWNGHRKQPIPKTDHWAYLVQYVSGAEGWNCTETDSVIFASLSYSYKNFEQAQGRIDRLDTPFSELFYYVLKSDSLIDRAIWANLTEKKLFNEREAAAKYML